MNLTCRVVGMAVLAGICLLLGGSHAGSAMEAGKRPVIQMAILLDTSNSMDGLINQARTQLWSVVNEFALAKRDGQTPELHLALYQYGNTRLPASGGYIQQVLPFTNDLDKVSEKLFALTTNGGEEFCGQVIQQATAELVWDTAPDTMKVIFIAGNEPFSQGTVDYKTACKASIGKGITVNTIFCGASQEGIATGWQDGATLADGAFMSIDADQQVVDIPTPQDAEILKLNNALNSTYIPYGTQGAAGQMNQVAQDMNAAEAAPSVATARAVSKSTLNYSNASWDLVDAVNTKAIKLEEVKTEDLPEAMRKMSSKERQEFIEKQAAERVRIQAEIGKLNTARTAFITTAQKQQATSGVKTLQDALLEAVRQQAVKQGFAFEAQKAPEVAPTPTPATEAKELRR